MLTLNLQSWLQPAAQTTRAGADGR